VEKKWSPKRRHVESWLKSMLTLLQWCFCICFKVSVWRVPWRFPSPYDREEKAQQDIWDQKIIYGAYTIMSDGYYLV
jgi:hypothetical protein